MVTVIDICVLTGAGLVGGICIGLLIKNKKASNLQNELNYLEDTYSNLVDTYTDCIIDNHKMQLEKYLNPTRPAKKEEVVVKKKVGRPKGSTNKTKTNGKPTTRKYTRKSSK
jgi:hypothetical protein